MTYFATEIAAVLHHRVHLLLVAAFYISFTEVLESTREFLQENRYEQIPQLSSMNPIDVNTKFDLVPDTKRGTKRAVMIGINYVGKLLACTRRALCLFRRSFCCPEHILETLSCCMDSSSFICQGDNPGELSGCWNDVGEANTSIRALTLYFALVTHTLWKLLAGNMKNYIMDVHGFEGE